MFAFLGTIGGLVGLNPLGKAAKLVGGLFALVLLVGILAGLKSCYDSSVTERHDLERDATTAKADRKADANTAEERRADDSRLQNEATELGKATENAQDPTARRVARQRCIRMQQAARAAGRQPPACR